MEKGEDAMVVVRRKEAIRVVVGRDRERYR